MNADTDIQDYVSAIRFRFFPPPMKLVGMSEMDKLLRWLRLPLDVLNTQLPDDASEATRKLRKLSTIPKMSTIAIGAIIRKFVVQMPADQVYLNIGVWNGFTFLAGLIDCPDKVCIGVDNFLRFGGPREAFLRRFQEHKSPQHQFFEMDYAEYLQKVHRGPIGVYLYDGDHSYEKQLQGLEMAEPFLADDGVILVDDTNKPAPWQATMDFVSARQQRYRIVVDQKTARNCHPTFWNGLMIVQRVA